MKKILGKDEDPSATRVFDRIMSMSKKDAGDLNRVLTNLNTRVAGDIRGGIINELGMAKASRATEPRQFSLDTFTTNWEKLSADAKRNLFSQSIVKDLNDLAKLTLAQRGVDQLGNSSRSGVFLENWRELGHVGRAAVGFTTSGVGALTGVTGGGSVIATLLGMPSAGFLLAQPRIARLMVRAARGEKTQVILDGLAEVARRNPAAAQDILGLKKAIENPNAVMIPQGAAPQAQQNGSDPWSEFTPASEATQAQPQATGADTAQQDNPRQIVQGSDGQYYDAVTGNPVSVQ